MVVQNPLSLLAKFESKDRWIWSSSPESQCLPTLTLPLRLSNTYFIGVVQLLSRVWLFCNPWIVAHQAPLSMGVPRQEYLNGFPFPSPVDLPNPGIKPASPTLAGSRFTTEPPGKPNTYIIGEQLNIQNKAEANFSVWSVLLSIQTRPPDLPLEKSVCRSRSNS